VVWAGWHIVALLPALAAAVVTIVWKPRTLQG
jgi:hypothetical protein